MAPALQLFNGGKTARRVIGPEARGSVSLSRAPVHKLPIQRKGLGKGLPREILLEGPVAC
jgi:hypothetical protein